MCSTLAIRASINDRPVPSFQFWYGRAHRLQQLAKFVLAHLKIRDGLGGDLVTACEKAERQLNSRSDGQNDHKHKPTPEPEAQCSHVACIRFANYPRPPATASAGNPPEQSRSVPGCTA